MYVHVHVYVHLNRFGLSKTDDKSMDDGRWMTDDGPWTMDDGRCNCDDSAQ